MRRTLIIAVIAVLALGIGIAAATPQQVAKIKQLTTQVKKQQAAINQRNATIDNLRVEVNAAKGGIFDYINAAPEADVFGLMEFLYARLSPSCKYDASVYRSSPYVSFTFSNIKVCQP